MNGLPLDHVGVATPSLRTAVRKWERLTGTTCSPIEELPDLGVNVAFLGSVELLEPRSPDTPLGRFLARRGPGLHHLAFRVPDVAGELARLQAAGFDPIDVEPRVGARGHLVAFVHPGSTGGVLWELVGG